MLSLPQSWGKFVKRITVNAPVQVVYNAWSTKAGIETWFLRKAIFTSNGVEKNATDAIAEDDDYIWRWHGYSDNVTEKGKIIAANGKDMLQFSFSGNCIVTVKAFEEDGETIAELMQENIPLEDDPMKNLYVGCGEGWTFYLANLKSILEGGIDLRNKNVNIQRVVNS